jgi:hypothetical protein
MNVAKSSSQHSASKSDISFADCGSDSMAASSAAGIDAK